MAGQSDERRIVLLGKSGAGKSSLANTIFGESMFKAKLSSKSVTSLCQAESKSVNGKRIKLIDTPGFFDTDMREEELKPEMVKCISECLPGPHAFLLVLKVETFTQQENEVIKKILQYFSEEAFKYSAVVFTHGDQLDEKTEIQRFVRKNKCLNDLVKKCGGRCHVIDNKYWKDDQQDEYRSNKLQVKQLLNTIEKMVEENGGGCYTNEMLQAVNNNKNLLTILLSVSVGVLLGALFGGVVIPLILASADIATCAAVPYVAAAGGGAVGGLTGFSIGQKAETPQDAVVETVKTVGTTSLEVCKYMKDGVDMFKKIKPNDKDKKEFPNERRIVLLGKTGAGKSSLANTLFGETTFHINHSPNVPKSICHSKSKSVEGRNVTLVDTPGFFDPSKPEKALKSEIVGSVAQCTPGPHAFLIVLKVEKFTDQEGDVVKRIEDYFSAEVFKYAVVAFTHGDQLAEEMKIQQFVSQNKRLRDLSKKCGGRCHVLDNRYWKTSQQDDYRSNQFQVTELLNTIETLVQENRGGCYTGAMLQAWQRQQASAGPLSNVMNWLFKFTANRPIKVIIGVALSVLLIVKTVNLLREANPGPVKGALHYLWPNDAWRIALLGKTGYGKSSSANTIFGAPVFEVRSSPNPTTARCRFTEHEEAVVGKINSYFSDEAFNYAVVVFTYGDQLDEGVTIEEFVSQNASLTALVRKCQDRCHVLDNKYWANNRQEGYRSNATQVTALLNTMRMLREHNGRRYTTEMLGRVHEQIGIVEGFLRRLSLNMSLNEITILAQHIVHRCLIRVTGAATGAVLGALFGLVSVGALVGLASLKILSVARAPTSEHGMAAVEAPTATTAVNVGAVGAVEGTVEGAVGKPGAIEVVIEAAGQILVISLKAAVVAGAIGGALVGGEAAGHADTLGEAMDLASRAVCEKAEAAAHIVQTGLGQQK
ncbi:GTPase IMAP family member 8-like [Genypterus blacodes]|uniref:GTPase IMAP family member 8-like n=1 Tax=Genypterus blacodes TaxID=154954 RepID=UPI003F76A11E